MISKKTLNQNKGDGYEKYVVDKLRSKYDNIWLWTDVPESILIENKIIINYDNYSKYRKYRKDIGIDIVAIKDDICTYIQCKNYVNNVCIGDIAGFLFFMIMHNVPGMLCYSNGISSFIEDQIKEKASSTRLKIILNHIPFDNIEIERSDKLTYVPRYYQTEAIKILSNKKHKKVVLSMPCGTGKTYTVSMVAKNYSNVVVLLPLIKLTADVLDNTSMFIGNSYKKILISSNGLRDVNEIRKKLKKKNVIGCTYDSTDVLIKFIGELKNLLIVIDEFHNLSDNNLNDKKKAMYKILNGENKIIFVSATPKKIMCDVKYEYEWKKAINEKFICPFNVTIPTKEVIDNDNLDKMIIFLNDISVSGGDDRKEIIGQGYFLLKSILYNGNKKCIVYVTSVDGAKLFENVITGITRLLNINVKVYVITSKTSRKNREDNIHYFRNNDVLSIMINVHILDEGIDVPECDSVFITKPSENINLLIQRLCRCNRVTKKKKTCNMYIWQSEKENLEKLLANIDENMHALISKDINTYNPINNKVIDENDDIMSNIPISKKIITNNDCAKSLLSERKIILENNDEIYESNKNVINISKEDNHVKYMIKHIDNLERDIKFMNEKAKIDLSAKDKIIMERDIALMGRDVALSEKDNKLNMLEKKLEKFNYLKIKCK